MKCSDCSNGGEKVDLGPAVFVGGAALSQLWLFIVAPIIGGILAALIWKYVFEK